MVSSKSSHASANALVGLWGLALTCFVIAAFYFAREILVPLALATMIGVSLATRDRVPGHTARFMVRLHTPEAVALDRG